MPRPILDEAHIHPAIRDKVAGNRMDYVKEVRAAIAAHPVVAVGMRQNPAPESLGPRSLFRRATRCLTATA